MKFTAILSFPVNPSNWKWDGNFRKYSNKDFSLSYFQIARNFESKKTQHKVLATRLRLMKFAFVHNVPVALGFLTPLLSHLKAFYGHCWWLGCVQISFLFHFDIHYCQIFSSLQCVAIVRLLSIQSQTLHRFIPAVHSLYVNNSSTLQLLTNQRILAHCLSRMLCLRIWWIHGFIR